MANLGSYLGLIGAAAVIWAGNRYINKRVKREVKVYGEENIKVAPAKPVGANESGVVNREPEVKNEGSNEQPSRVQDKPLANNEPDKRESERTNKTSKFNRAKTPRVVRLEE
jgi:hypothetical protein